MLTDNQRRKLVSAARAAVALAFLTAPCGTAYGAAVLTASGRTLQAGQYSSFNHITNVQAEQAALLLAAMTDDPDVLALAVASTGDESVTRPCGVCCQVLAEHAVRTSRDFEVLMARRHDTGYEHALVSQLLHFPWSPGRRGSDLVLASSPRTAPLRAGVPLYGRPLQVGDHVVLSDGSVAMVWDGSFSPGKALTKIKYAPPSDGGRRKLPHSFTQSLLYQKELHDLGWDRPAAGSRAAVVSAEDVREVLSVRPLGDGPGPLIDVLRLAGVDPASIRVTGSRSIGLQTEGSDWDLVVPLGSGQIDDVRRALFDALERGTLALLRTSGTWQLHDSIFPGGREMLLRGRRYLDMVRSGETTVTLVFVPPTSGPCLEDGWQEEGRVLFHGRVREVSATAFKRAEYMLDAGDAGEVRVTCYHKSANLLRADDVISIRGWLLRRGDERRLIQLLLEPGGIVWLEVSER